MLERLKQSILRARYRNTRIEDCLVYHWFDTPDGRVIPGLWDLRAGWRTYLGSYNFAGKRVFEAGPASGFLSLKMEADGADITCFDIGDGVKPDLLFGDDTSWSASSGPNRLRLSWFYFHRMFGSKNKAVFGNIYALPGSLGRFDVSVVAAILLHLANPFHALREIAKITNETIIITELYDPRLDGSGFMEFDPNDGHGESYSWWLISPGACVRMLRLLGFPAVTTTFHEHRLHLEGDPGVFSVLKWFTIVAHREPARTAP
jgi:O-methyltransferase